MIGELIFTRFWAVSLTMTLFFVAARMLAVGLSVEPAELAVLRRHPGFVARALFANFIVVPALGVALGAMVWVPAQAALALVLLALMAGGVDFLAPAERSNVETREGPALIFVLSFVAGLLGPIVRLLLQPIGTPIMGSFWRVVDVTLLVVPLPLVAGILLRWKAPAAARVLARAMALVAVVLFVAAALTTFAIKAPTIREIGARGVLAMVILVAGAAVAGWALGGPSAEHRGLLVHLTVMRNVGLSLLLAIVTFPNAGVDVAVLLFAVVAVVLRLLGLLFGRTIVPSVPALSRWSRKA